ncbi:MAG TPA: type II secretion system protein GspL [Steroidobacteraceae bacterium]|nr:type II secretion system protein GspL [Steroidobacteraceae bacterium]
MATGDWLLLRLPATPGGMPLRALVDSTGALLPLPEDSPESLLALAAGRQVALLAPSADVALFMAQLPAGNEARLQQLAPFALEEQVSEDLEQLHFAIGNRTAATGEVPVAVVSRGRMRDWLAQAGALGITPRAIFAESDLAPLLPGHVTLLVTPEGFVLRNDGGRPVVFPADDPALALTMLLGPGADLSTVNLSVHALPADWPPHEAAIEALRERVAALKVQLHAGGLLGLYAQGISSSAPVNLLQGAFKPQRRGTNFWLRWRVAAALLGALLLLHMAAGLWELRAARQEARQLDAEISRVYGSIFPGQQPGRQLRRTLEARIRAVAGGGGAQGELMGLLAALAAARQNVPMATLDAMTYKPGLLQLTLSAPDAATLEQFSQALRAGGFGATVASGNQTERGFKGQIDMKVAGT